MRHWTDGIVRRRWGSLLDGAALAVAAAGGLFLSARLHGEVPAGLSGVLSAFPADAARLTLVGAALGCWLTATGALYVKVFRRPASAPVAARGIALGAGLAALSVFVLLALWPSVPLARAASDAVLPSLAAAALVGLVRAAELALRGPGAHARTLLLVEPSGHWQTPIAELRHALGRDWRLAAVTVARAGALDELPLGVERWDAAELEAWLAGDLSRRQARQTLVAFDREVPDTPLHGRLVRKAFFDRTVIADLAQVYEEIVEKVPLIEGEDSWYTNPGRPRNALSHLALKRAMDLAIAVPLFVLTLPVVAILALAVRLDSPGAPILTQRRVGLGGREFTLYKLRSMTVHADDSAQWPHFAAGRITRLGRVLRKTGLDELPQLANVIRGDMSLVGPRPARPLVTERHIARNPFYAAACSMRPGISGWAQLHQGQDADDHTMFEKVRYNLYYVRNFTIWLDLLICIRTFWQLVSGRKQASVHLAERQDAPQTRPHTPTEAAGRKAG